MNTSLIKKDSTEQGIETVMKPGKRITGTAVLRKNDLIAMLHDENDALYEEYMKVIKRNTELRVIIEKQQKIINAIYNAELNFIIPEEKAIAAPEPECSIPLKEAPAEAPKPEVKPPAPQPLDVNSLAKRMHRLQKKQFQSQKSLLVKAKFLLALYNAPKGIHCDELFAACGLTRVTGLRYASFLRKFSFISHGGHYSIKEHGKKFVEGVPYPEWDKYQVKNWKPIY